jgi:hypothetical protein
MTDVESPRMGPDNLERAFGLAIAYLLPGAIGLAGLSAHSASVRGWFGFVATHDTTLAGFLFVAGGSTAVGVLLSAVGAFLYDRKRNRPVQHDHSGRETKEQSYQQLISQHYHYYLCYRNSSIALPLAVVSYLTSRPFSWALLSIAGGGAVMMTLILWWAANDAIDRFETKRASLLRSA